MDERRDDLKLKMITQSFLPSHLNFNANESPINMLYSIDLNQRTSESFDQKRG